MGIEVLLATQCLDGIQITHPRHRNVLQSRLGHLQIHGKLLLPVGSAAHHINEQQDGEDLQQSQFPVEKHDQVAADKGEKGKGYDGHRVVYHLDCFGDGCISGHQLARTELV